MNNTNIKFKIKGLSDDHIANKDFNEFMQNKLQKPKDCNKPLTKQIPCPLESVNIFGGKPVRLIDNEIHPLCAICGFYTGYIQDNDVLDLRKKICLFWKKYGYESNKGEIKNEEKDGYSD